MFGIDDAIAAGLKILDKFIPDPAEKAKAEGELRGALLAWDQMQASVNVEEAKSSSIFVAGWRPFVGWTCGASFALNVVVLPLLNFVIVANGGQAVVIPMDTNLIMSTLFGMLGLGGLRTFEKIKGVAK
jgi:hypothetical protein